MSQTLRHRSDLRPYQKKAIRSCLERASNALFIDMGLGKTAITLFTLKRRIELKQSKRVLLVAPLRVCYSVWRQEAQEWAYLRDLRFSILHGEEKKERFWFSTAHVDIINYEGLIWLGEEIRAYAGKLQKFPYDTVVFDESSYIKNHSSKRFLTLKPILCHFRYRFILTASPTPNHLTDIWTQQFIMDLGESFHKYYTTWEKQYFYNPPRDSYTLLPHDWAKKDIYKQLSKYSIRLEAEDRVKRPKEIINPLYLELPEHLKKLYKQLEREYSAEIDGHNVETFFKAGLYMKLRQILQGAVYVDTSEQTGIAGSRVIAKVDPIKIPLLEEIVSSLNGRPLICAIQFKFELEILKKLYPKAAVITGGVSPKESERIRNQWNADKISLLICHPQSLSHGLNLQHGSGRDILWLANTWSLDNFKQLNGRIIRPGNKADSVTVHVPIVRNTIDEILLAGIKRKETTQYELLKAVKKYIEHRMDENEKSNRHNSDSDQ